MLLDFRTSLIIRFFNTSIPIEMRLPFWPMAKNIEYVLFVP